MSEQVFYDDIISVIRKSSEFSADTVELKPETVQQLYQNFGEKSQQLVAEASPESAYKTEIDKILYGDPLEGEVQPAFPSQPSKPYNQMDLNELNTEVQNCRNCQLCNKRTNTVFGDGNPSADLMFIGEGPGYDEDKQGIPFVGRAGQLLNKMITAMKFDRSEVYIANIVKCRPPGNRNPEDEEAEQCLPYLRRQIELVNPKVIVLLGAVPLKYLLNKKGITRIHGNWDQYMGIQTMPIFHPSFLLRVTDRKREAWEDLKKVMAVLGKVPN